MSTLSSFDVFLSFANTDRAWVQGYLIPALGVPRERIITHNDFRLGAPRVSEIERAVTTSRYSVLILSPAYLADEWANFGEQLASHLTTAEQSVRLIPLLKSECELPLRIDFRVRLDCTDPANWERETARLRDLLNQPAPQPERIACPYPGMIPFRVEDARWFYGRAKEIDELVRRIRVQNLLFVIGPSGSGKSSLVFAGLVAELNKRQPDTWHVQTMRPGSDPLSALNDSTIALSNYRTNALIVIDQFEELFTQSDKPTQAAFIARLKSLRAENRCTIVITMRADFYPDLMNSDLWPLDPSERVELAPLRGAALAEAIAKPAEKVGVYLEAGLVERLLADAADEPGVLPLVQETMVLLWNKRERRLLPLRAYEELGQGNLSGLAVAIATRADAVFAQLDESQRKIARRIFLRLVQFGEGRADTRRQQRVSALRVSGDEPNEFDRTLKHLTDNRLLTLTGEEKDADRQVDIAHEALIAGWQRFRQWVNERREAEQTRRRLEDKAREWERLGRGNAGLLDDVELREAENWLKSADATDLGYSETLPELIDISRAEIQQVEREKEEAKQRELAQAKALAEEQKQRAETERRSRVRQRYFTIGLAVFLVLAIVAAGMAFNQYSYANQQFGIANQQRAEALKQKQIGDSRRLAAQSASLRDREFELSLLLAAESSRMDVNTEVYNNFLVAITNKPQLSSFLFGHKDNVYSVAFSPDRKMLASGSEGGTIILWDVSTRQPIGKPLIDPSIPLGSVYSIVFSPDGKTLAAGIGYVLVLWDISTGRRIGRSMQNQESIFSVAFSPDGKTLASGSSDKTIALWNVNTQQLKEVLRGHNWEVNSVAFSPDGKVLASASSDKTILLWDVNTQQPIGQPLLGHSSSVRSVSFSPDGKTLASASGGYFSSGSCQNSEIILWDVSTRQRIRIPLSAPECYVSSVAFSPDGKTLASNVDRTIVQWDVNTHQQIDQALTGHQGLVNSVSFSPDGQMLVSGDSNATIILWNVNNQQSIGQPPIVKIGNVRDVVFSPDARTLASVSCGHFSTTGLCDNSEIILWDTATRQRIGQPLRGHTAYVTSVAFSPDGKTLASSSYDKTIILWDIATHQMIGQPLTGHTDPVYSIAFSPDGKTLASSSDLGKIILWDVNTRSPIRESILERVGIVFSLAYNPDGKTLALGSSTNDVFLWDLATRQMIGRPLKGHTGPVYSVAFSPDGKILVSGSRDKTLILWDMATRQMIGQPLKGHTDSVSSVTFSPDGKMLASGSADGTIILWDMDVESWKARACYIANRNLTLEEWKQYIDSDPSTYRATCPGLPLEPATTPTPKP